MQLLPGLLVTIVPYSDLDGNAVKHSISARREILAPCNKRDTVALLTS